ncbi:unnamed protein product [Adineta ricciae]|uniref:Uncharacterized protein n=1 Tax=Adineta ricciae TaxID=249248 RepID=A0A813S314_ADIRI|nr:unnamed protein product [Adineta ricciae]CAF0791490.1 unnamed protein product [Adineta ricciae]
MNIEDEPMLQDTDNVSSIDLNATQISGPVDDSVPTDIGARQPTNSLSLDALPKSDLAPVNSSCKPRSSGPAKKKRASEMKVRLVQELIGKIEAANENASRSEIKILELPERQMQFHQENTQNENEFFNIFKKRLVTECP